MTKKTSKKVCTPKRFDNNYISFLWRTFWNLWLLFYVLWLLLQDIWYVHFPYLRQSKENDTKLISFSIFWGNFNFQYYNIAMLYTISGQWISGCNWVLTFDEQHQLFLKSRVHKSRNFKCANFNLKVHAWVCQISLVWNIYSNISEEYLFVSYLHHFLIQSYLEFVDTVFCLPIIF